MVGMKKRRRSSDGAGSSQQQLPLLQPAKPQQPRQQQPKLLQLKGVDSMGFCGAALSEEQTHAMTAMDSDGPVLSDDAAIKMGSSPEGN